MTRKAASTALGSRPPLRLSICWQMKSDCSRYLRAHLLATHRLLSPPLAELSLAIVDDARMTGLHDQFLQIPTTTDVLTFPLEVDQQERPTSGEVVVCYDVARRQAGERGHNVREELLLYALHGMLHLCGFDDRTDSAYRRMHRTEDQILRQLGVGALFADLPPRPPSGRRTQVGARPQRLRRRTAGVR